MSERMRSYEAARTYFSVLGFLSWGMIILGGVVALVSLVAVGQMSRSFGGSSMAGIAGLIPGVAVMFSGFMGLVVVQIGRAGVDSAEHGQQMLKVARDQLEVSKQSLKRQEVDSRSFAALESPTEQAPTTSFERTEPRVARQPKAAEPGEHRGLKIYRVGGSYRAVGHVFPNHADAVAAIDAKLDAPAIESKPEIPVPELGAPESEAPREAELLPAEQVATVEETPPPRSYAERAEDDKLSPLPVSEAVQADEEAPIELVVQETTPDVDEASAPQEKRPSLIIEEENGKFIYGRMKFSSREAAEKYVSQLGVNPNFQS